MPNRADAELRWTVEDETVASRGLSRAAIVATAIAVADAEGFSAVSIRRVASELEARPMSLYTHIASKDDLVDLMINEVIAGVLVPEPLPGDWRAALTAIAHASYGAFAAHSWVLDAFAASTRTVPNGLRHAEQSAAATAVLGVDPPTTWTILGILDDFTIGHAIRTSMHKRVARTEPKDFDPVAFPNLARIAPDGWVVRLPNAFDLGLEVVLDGIESRFLS